MTVEEKFGLLENKQALLKALATPDFTDKDDDKVQFNYQGFIKGVMSNWYPVDFEIDGIKYKNSEQYYMAKKAEFFNDQITLGRILETFDPRRIKELGRRINGFSEKAWYESSEQFMFEANFAKYDQNPHVARILLETGDDILVEANPADLIWGAGIDMNDSRIKEPCQWPGINRLGFVLMKVRYELREKLKTGEK